MTFVCYDRCSTCKKAQAWLDERAPYEAEGAYDKPRWLYGPEA